MFSSKGEITIRVSGGTSWIQVPMNSNYPSQEIWIDGNKYAPVSEVNKPVHSTPLSTSGGSISTAPDLRNFARTPSSTTPLWNLSPELYSYYYYQQEKAKEQEKRQQEALITANINKQLDRAASEQYSLMDKLYIQDGLDAMRQEYYRLCGGTEGANSVYARAAYNALCNKDKEEAINTPTITKSANEYYDKGGIESLKGLVNYYENNGYPIYANIAKRILKQKIVIEKKERAEEHYRRMQQDPEYAENYKIKELESEICKLTKEIEEQYKENPFAGQPLNDLVINRIKAFNYSKNLGYEGAKAYLKELQLPENERFF